MSDRVCPPFPVVPPTAVCRGACPEMAICRVPDTYPKITTVSTLRVAYSFDEDNDFNDALQLAPTTFGIAGSGGNIENIGNPCETESDANIKAIYNYIDVISAQERKTARASKWILNAKDRLCTGNTAGITKGPAHMSLYNSIQEVMSPPTIAPGVIPGITQKGTLIPKPDLDDFEFTPVIPEMNVDMPGILVLTYINNKLKWVVCPVDIESSESSGTPDVEVDCEKLKITAVRILKAADAAPSANLTVSDIQNSPAPVVEIEWEYEGWIMPATSVAIQLLATPQDTDKKPIASAGWINSPYTAINHVIGPIQSDTPPPIVDGDEEPPEPPTLTGSAQFQFIWSATNCYDKTQDKNNLSDTDITCNVSFPSCRDITTKSSSVSVTCDAATGVLSAKKIDITDELGIVYLNNQIGKDCDSTRSGTFYVYIEYENATDNMYIADSELPGIQIQETVDVSVGYEKLKAPSELAPHSSLGASYRVNFELYDTACSGAIFISVPSVPDAKTSVIINPECEECPGFKIVGVSLIDTLSGQPIQDTWDVGCTSSASRRVTVVATVESTSSTSGYRNKDNDKLIFEVTPDVGIELTEPPNNTIPVPNVAAGNTASVSVDYIVTTTKELQVVETLEEVSANVEFKVTADATNDDPDTDAAMLSVTKICGVLGLVPGSVRLYRVMGSQFELVTMPINDCTPGAYEFVLGYDLQNVSEDATFNDYVTVESSIECKEGDLAVGPYSHSTTKEITNLRPGEIVTGYTPRFTVQTAEGSLSGQVQISFEISEYSIDGSKTVGINEDCPESSSSSGSSSSDPCDGDPKCCPWLKSGDEDWVEVTKDPEDGRCVVGLTDKAKNTRKEIIGGSCISVTEVTEGENKGKLSVNSTLTPDNKTIKIEEGTGENAGKCLISAVIPDSNIKGGNCISVTEGTGDDKGKLIIASTLKPADNTIDITEGTGENAGKCLISAKLPNVCELFEQTGRFTHISKNTTSNKCQIDCTLQNGTGIGIDEKNGKINIDTNWLQQQIADAITAWFNDSNNVTEC